MGYYKYHFNKEEVKQVRLGINKKGKNVPNKDIILKRILFCKVHAKNQKYLIPTKELKNIEN